MDRLVAVNSWFTMCSSKKHSWRQPRLWIAKYFRPSKASCPGRNGWIEECFFMVHRCKNWSLNWRWLRPTTCTATGFRSGAWSSQGTLPRPPWIRGWLERAGAASPVGHRVWEWRRSRQVRRLAPWWTPSVRLRREDAIFRWERR